MSRTDTQVTFKDVQIGGNSLLVDEDFESNTFGALTTTQFNGGVVSIVGPDNGFKPLSGTKMVKCYYPGGSQATINANLTKQWTNLNTCYGPNGIYHQWFMLIPSATIAAIHENTFGNDSQIKLHLYREITGNPANWSPPAYHGLIFATGFVSTFSNNGITIGSDNNNIWLFGVEALDTAGSWHGNPGYRGDVWVEVQEFYRTNNGIDGEYKLWIDKILVASTYVADNSLDPNNRMVGGPSNSTRYLSLGIAYAVCRSANPLVVYIDRVKVTDYYIDEYSKFYEHEPPNFTAIKTCTCSTLADGWIHNSSWTDTNQTNIVTDITAPMSPSSVVEFKYFAGWVDNINNAAIIEAGSFNLTEVYCAFWIKVKSPFQAHPTGVQKLALFGTNHIAGNISETVLGMWGSGPTFNIGMSGNDTNVVPNNIFGSNIRAQKFTLDTWHRVEVYLKASTGPADGISKVWVDGYLTENQTTIQYNTAGPASFDGFRFHPYWGGTGGNAKSQTDYIYLDHLYISGK